MPPFVPSMLTPRQQQLVETIAALQAANGYAPSMAEVAAAMDVHRSRVSQLAGEVEWKGRIVRTPGRCRSWRVVEPAAVVERRSSPSPRGART